MEERALSFKFYCVLKDDKIVLSDMAETVNIKRAHWCLLPLISYKY
jgi:hypothetical protein